MQNASQLFIRAARSLRKRWQHQREREWGGKLRSRWLFRRFRFSLALSLPVTSIRGENFSTKTNFVPETSGAAARRPTPTAFPANEFARKNTIDPAARKAATVRARYESEKSDTTGTMGATGAVGERGTGTSDCPLRSCLPLPPQISRLTSNPLKTVVAT